MGGKSSSIGPKDAKTDIIIEICQSWGYDSRVKYVTDYIIQPIKDEGLTIKYQFVPMKGGKGQFFLYGRFKGKKEIVFSNQKNLHPDAIHGMNISLKNKQEIIDRLKERI